MLSLQQALTQSTYPLSLNCTAQGEFGVAGGQMWQADPIDKLVDSAPVWSIEWKTASILGFKIFYFEFTVHGRYLTVAPYLNLDT